MRIDGDITRLPALAAAANRRPLDVRRTDRTDRGVRAARERAVGRVHRAGAVGGVPRGICVPAESRLSYRLGPTKGRPTDIGRPTDDCGFSPWHRRAHAHSRSSHNLRPQGYTHTGYPSNSTYDYGCNHPGADGVESIAR